MQKKSIGNMRRREDIKRNWFFDCACPRCSDATEMGSFMSAVGKKYAFKK